MDRDSWEGDDAPTNVAPPDFVKAKERPAPVVSGFWKGVAVGVGACATLGAFAAIGGAVIAVAMVGVPSLPVPAAAIAQTDTAPAVVAALPGELEIAKAAPVGTAIVAGTQRSLPLAPVATPEPAKIAEAVEPEPEPVAIATPEPARFDKAKLLERVEAKRVERVERVEREADPIVELELADAPAKPVATPTPAPRPDREELLKLALAAKKSAAPAPTPTPAPKAVPVATPYVWDEPRKDTAPAEEEEKWFPTDEEETTSAPSKGKGTSSDDLSDVLGK